MIPLVLASASIVLASPQPTIDKRNACRREDGAIVMREYDGRGRHGPGDPTEEGPLAWFTGPAAAGR